MNQSNYGLINNCNQLFSIEWDIEFFLANDILN